MTGERPAISAYASEAGRARAATVTPASKIPPQSAAAVAPNMLGYRDQPLQERSASRLLKGRCLALVACTGVAAAPFFHAENVLAAEITPR